MNKKEVAAQIALGTMLSDEEIVALIDYYYFDDGIPDNAVAVRDIDYDKFPQLFIMGGEEDNKYCNGVTDRADPVFAVLRDLSLRDIIIEIVKRELRKK